MLNWIKSYVSIIFKKKFHLWVVASTSRKLSTKTYKKTNFLPLQIIGAWLDGAPWTIQKYWSIQYISTSQLKSQIKNDTRSIPFSKRKILQKEKLLSSTNLSQLINLNHKKSKEQLQLMKGQLKSHHWL